jgi:diguanylate cyclase (GGDEF)-like protein
MTESLAEARAISEAREAELAEQADRLDRVLTMSREVAGSLNLTYVLRAVATSTLSLAPFYRMVVWLLDEADARLRAAYDSATMGDGVSDAADIELGRDLVGQAAKYGRTMTRGADNVFRSAVQEDLPIAGIAVPMVVGARVIGVLKCFLDPPAVLSPMTTEVLETLASQAATAVEAARLHERTEQLSQTDALTRLFNRRRLDADLEAECYRANRYERPLSFVMLDVDHFKLFNDRFGHQRGDEALEMVAKVIADTARESDTAYRFGGEELAVLCRETDLEGASELAERLRVAVERRMEAEGVTASFGVAALGPGTTSPEELVEAADRAMYEAKHAGRNRVAVAGRPTPPMRISR